MCTTVLYVVMLFVPIKNIQICIFFSCRHLQCITSSTVCDEREHESNKTDDAMRKTFLKHEINKILTTIKVQRQSSWNL